MNLRWKSIGIGTEGGGVWAPTFWVERANNITLKLCSSFKCIGALLMVNEAMLMLAMLCPPASNRQKFYPLHSHLLLNKIMSHWGGISKYPLFSWIVLLPVLAPHFFWCSYAYVEDLTKINSLWHPSMETNSISDGKYISCGTKNMLEHIPRGVKYNFISFRNKSSIELWWTVYTAEGIFIVSNVAWILAVSEIKISWPVLPHTKRCISQNYNTCLTYHLGLINWMQHWRLWQYL